MALNVPEPTFHTFREWADELQDENNSLTDFPVTPPRELDWKPWAAALSRYNNLYPSPYYMTTWKEWAKIIYELEIV